MVRSKTGLDSVKGLGTILSVWAHPDDETICCGGLMSLAVKNGQRVVCATATKGEKGVQDESRWPAARLGDIRAHELTLALHHLGLNEHYWLGCVDGELPDVPVEEGAGKIASLIKMVKPDTILTFPSDGVTGHEDHKTISHWVDVAVTATGSKAVVYQAATTQEAYDDCLCAADEKFNFYFNIDKPKLTPHDRCDLCVDLTGKMLERKVEALKMMPSQYEKILEGMGDDWAYRAMACESFMKAPED